MSDCTLKAIVFQTCSKPSFTFILSLILKVFLHFLLWVLQNVPRILLTQYHHSFICQAACIDYTNLFFIFIIFILMLLSIIINEGLLNIHLSFSSSGSIWLKWNMNMSHIRKNMSSYNVIVVIFQDIFYSHLYLFYIYNSYNCSVVVTSMSSIVLLDPWWSRLRTQPFLAWLCLMEYLLLVWGDGQTVHDVAFRPAG